MTEYKKLVSLTDQLAKDVTNLHNSPVLSEHAIEEDEKGATAAAPPSAASDPEHLYTISCRIRHSLVDGCKRIRKMVLRAREADPNQQIYNETMCGKIEELFRTFCSLLEQLSPSFSPNGTEALSAPLGNEEENMNLFDAVLDVCFDAEAIIEQSPTLQKVEDIHNRYILKRAKEEAWQSRVAQGLSDVITFEGQQRSLITAEEKFARSALREDKRSDKLRTILLLEEREAVKWSTELQRRVVEQKCLQENTSKIHDVAKVSSALQTVLPDATMRRKVVAHVRQLIKALLKTPEDLNIRRLRNNNEHLICDYGHPCLIATASEGTEQCACASAVCAAEMLWHRMGYVIRYTNTPNGSAELLRLEKRAEMLLLPCGGSLAAHTYKPLGFEDYSERFFELMEPNAMEKPDDWMVWYNMMQEMEHALDGMLSQ